jgi:hypothetical protein
LAKTECFLFHSLYQQKKKKSFFTKVGKNPNSLSYFGGHSLYFSLEHLGPNVFKTVLAVINMFEQ